MRSAKPTFLAILALALAAYAFDCSAATTPEQAMQCCKSMACSSHGHDAQDCCKTMPSMHAPFVQPSSGHGVSPSHLVFAMPATEKARAADSSKGVIAAHCHAPPIRYGPVPLPLRI
jgi:hypothetical protein